MKKGQPRNSTVLFKILFLKTLQNFVNFCEIGIEISVFGSIPPNGSVPITPSLSKNDKRRKLVNFITFNASTSVRIAQNRNR